MTETLQAFEDFMMGEMSVDAATEFIREARAEQALALRGEPVANEKIDKLIDKAVRKLRDPHDGDSEEYIVEQAILQGIALYAAPISGERVEPRYWLIHFDDRDRPLEVFTERNAALRRYDQISGSWNATLFESIHDNSQPGSHATRPKPAVSGERVREAQYLLALEWCYWQMVSSLPCGERTAQLPTFDEYVTTAAKARKEARNG